MFRPNSRGFLFTFLLLLYFIPNIQPMSNWLMYASLPHRNRKRNPATYVTHLLMFQGKTGWKWKTSRNIWFKRKTWEELIPCLYKYVYPFKSDKNSLNGTLQPHLCFCIKWSKLARAKFKHTSSPLTAHSFFFFSFFFILRPAGIGMTHAYAVLQTLYFKMQIFSTSLLCHTSNCKLQETKIRRQTTIARGIRNS